MRDKRFKFHEQKSFVLIREGELENLNFLCDQIRDHKFLSNKFCEIILSNSTTARFSPYFKELVF